MELGVKKVCLIELDQAVASSSNCPVTTLTPKGREQDTGGAMSEHPILSLLRWEM